MIDSKKKILLPILFFSLPIFGEEISSHKIRGTDLPESSSQKVKSHSSPIKPYHIITKNKDLFKSLNRYFKKRMISEKEIQKFLIKNSYYQAEIFKQKSDYLIENPIQTIFVLKGNKFFNEKKIRKFIQIDEHKTGVRFYDFVETAIKQAYQRQGFLKIKIEKKTVRKKWKEWIYLKILEGSRIRIAEIKVKGLLSKPASQYESFIENNSTALIKKGFYNKKDLEVGYEKLINDLKSQGYLQSKIYSDRIFFKEDEAFITINLEEGPLTLIRDIKVQNTQALPIWEILSHIKSRAHSPLKVDLLEEDLNSIEQLYKSKGHLNMKITNRENIIQYTPGERYASIVINIDEGPKVFVSKITVKGLKRTKETMVRKLLMFKPGDTLTSLKKEQSLLALGETGLFTDVSLNEKPVDDYFEVLAVFRERKPRLIRGGLGVNSERGLTTRAYSELAHRNLFGWGRALIARISGQVNLNQKEAFLEYELSGRYKEVFTPGDGYHGDVSFSHSKNRFGYSKDTNNINFVRKNTISFFINKKINKNLKARWNILSFENRREACTKGVCPENPQRISSTGLNLAWDRRDNMFDPSYGNLNSLTTELALPVLGSSSNIAFVKADFQNQFYYTFAEKYTLGLALKGGLIRAIQNSSYIPVSRAFILGGQTSISGYDGHIKGERIPNKRHVPIETANEALKLKKSESTENVLNSHYGLINTDFRFPVFKDFKVSLFYDLGAVHLKSKNNAIFDYGHSVGVGFRYQIFIIPIGLDIARKLPPKEGSNFRFHVAIGW